MIVFLTTNLTPDFLAEVFVSGWFYVRKMLAMTTRRDYYARLQSLCG